MMAMQNKLCGLFVPVSFLDFITTGFSWTAGLDIILVIVSINFSIALIIVGI
jgi:hypothetical protein